MDENGFDTQALSSKTEEFFHRLVCGLMLLEEEQQAVGSHRSSGSALLEIDLYLPQHYISTIFCLLSAVSIMEPQPAVIDA